MRRPHTAMLLGHPLLLLPLSVGTCVAAYRAMAQPSLWLLALGLGFIAIKAANANGARAAYLAWKRTWDAMDGDGTAGNRARVKRPLLGGALVALLVIYCVSHPTDPGSAFALTWLAIIGAVAGIWTMLGKLSKVRARKAVPSPPVAICVTGPLLPLPNGTQAYAALPDYCQRLLGQ